ncbi:MAG: hypothetical protein LLG06_06465 [Desulfobacteraceae bacterium]|nr:hypothetical protein [Desulfobacteraceae bacterium]
MLTLPSSIVRDLHKLASSGAIVFLLSVPHYELYWARNTADIVWRGNTYVRSWFDLGLIAGSSDASLPSLVVSISNIGGMVEHEVVRRNSFRGVDMNLYIVDSNCLYENTPLYQMVFQVLKPTCRTKSVEFKLGIENPILMSFPSWKTHGAICQYTEFGGYLCRYVGLYTECDRSVSNCIARSNVERFGAQLGIMGEIYEES